MLQTVEVRTVTLKVVMHCEGCAGSVKRAVKRIRGTQIHDIHMYHPLSENIVKMENIVEGAISVSGHCLKLYFCMFEKSQGNHNNLNCQIVFGE